ncbi:Cullin-5 [Schistosoma japonicum]|uniref:Cullin-5 n=1 Tax=Schistosoma japonicum TaxID=6182 RepID=A0A4Z2D4D2_SCHJA|nr:Cullin-5 [Schistosoma japonicum]
MRNQDESSLLKSYIAQWNKFSKQSEYLPQPFSPLENYLVGKHLNGPNKRHLQESTIRKLMLETWNSTIYESIKQKLLDSAIKLIQDERCGQVIDSQLVVGVRESCVNLSTLSEKSFRIYVDNFEKAYIESTESFYRIRIEEYIREHGIRSYMQYALQKLAEEEARAVRYLETQPEFNSVPKLVKVCLKTFVVDYMDPILSEVPRLLHDEDTSQLRLCYELINRVPQEIDPLLVLLEEYIRKKGLDDIRANAEDLLKDADKYVCHLLNLYVRFSHMISDAFNNDPHFLTARDKAYQDIVNNTSVFVTEIPTSVRSGISRVESRCPELLASYCDMLLRKSPTNRRLTTDEIEKKLRNVLLILKYVNSKDIFMRVHKSHLTRRLILETSADNETEELMAERLREVGMPAEQINKLRRMFQDMKISHDLTSEFKEKYKASQCSSSCISPNNNNTPSLNLDIITIKILSGGAWLLRPQPQSSISLPAELEDFLPHIEDFYRQKHQGRSLLWQHHLSHGVLAYTSDHGRYEFEVTTYQLVVLYAWNRRYDQHLRLDCLLTSTGLRDIDLRRTLWSLCEHPKLEQQLIYYSPKVSSEKQFTTETEFWLNLKFVNTKMGKVQNRRRINLIGRLQLTHEVSSEEESMAVVELRQLRAQEGIIKILKTRKRLHHNELYQELVDLLRFQFVPSKRLIKEVLEWLIDKRYVRRDNNDMNVFVYVT